MNRLFRFFLKNFKRILWNFFVNIIGASKVMPDFLRCQYYKIFGLKVNTLKVSPDCYFKNKKVSIGKGSFVNYNVFFDSTAHIEIGDNCDIAFGTIFCTATHEIGNQNKRAGKGYGLPIKIGDGTWIGAQVTILPNVKIGNGCIIAAGSVVTKDCKSNGLYAGVPAIRIKDLEEKQ